VNLILNTTICSQPLGLAALDGRRVLKTPVNPDENNEQLSRALSHTATT
jgi:hypothetical protein